MEIYQAILLALIQGVTEFLPISSSAHLILPSQLLGWPDQGLAFDVAVHLGTLISVMIYFRGQLKAMMLGCCSAIQARKLNEDAKLALAVVVGVIPAGIAGFLLENYIETLLRSIGVIAATTIVFGVLLGLSDRFSTRKLNSDAISLTTAFLVGCAQALALIPGTSRSGITITAALLLGFTREAAARFSFLLSIPLIFAAGGMKTLELIQAGDHTPWLFITVGTVVSSLSAFLCIRVFLAVLDKIGMMPFAIYRLLLGAGLLLMI